MINHSNRFGFSSNRRDRNKKNKSSLFFGAAIVLIVLVIVLIVTNIIPVQSLFTSDDPDLISLWQEQKYTEIIELTRENLESNPLDHTSLSLLGFSLYFKAVSQVSVEEKIAMLDQAIFALRKTKLLNRTEGANKINYILGQAYYHKGRFYADYAIKYINEAIENGYDDIWAYEYLGLAYSSLEKYDDSIESFEKAVELNPTDMLFLTLGRTYMQVENYDKSEEYLLKAINKTEDKLLEQKSRMLLGDIYIEKRSYVKAEDQYEKVIQLNPNNADAYFFLGEIYSELNQIVEARSQWRKARQINPSHSGANSRLNN